jgi:hypothetical protein
MPSEATAPPTEHPQYDGPKLAAAESFGLRHNALSPIETLAQSVSTIAPSTSPQLTIPLVFVLAGQGTAIAYLIAMGLMVLVGLCIFAGVALRLYETVVAAGLLLHHRARPVLRIHYDGLSGDRRLRRFCLCLS